MVQGARNGITPKGPDGPLSFPRGAELRARWCDEIFGRIRDRDLSYLADLGQTQLGTINYHDDGRGLYCKDPSGHLVEVITH